MQQPLTLVPHTYHVHGAQALSIGSRRQLAMRVRECGLCSGELSMVEASTGLQSRKDN